MMGAMDSPSKMQSGAVSAPSETPPQLGEVRIGAILWERFEVAALLGTSELGELWRCYDRDLRRQVVLRSLSAELRRSKQMLAAVHAGIQRMSDQTHPNLAAIRQLIYVGDSIYVMGDYATGNNLDAWRQKGEGGTRALAEILPILEQVAAALDFAHGQQIVHRNLKPSKVYVDEKGVARVTDFGLAPNRSAPQVHGTTGAYLAPELRRKGAVPDEASDQYAFAAVAWELLAGNPPGCEGGELPEGVSPCVREAFKRALSRRAWCRYRSCGDFVRALKGEKVAERRGRNEEDWKRMRLRLGLAAAGVALAVLLVGAGMGLASWLGGASAEAGVAGEVEVPAEDAPAPAAETQRGWQPPTPWVADTELPTPGRPWVAGTVGMEMAWIDALQMWVGRYEVTNGEYVKKEPGHESGETDGICLNGPRQPAVRINFDETVAYAAWLTEQERAAGRLAEGWRYRLPSRLEAIAYTRAGGASVYPWGDAWPPVRGNYADEALGSAFPGKASIAGYNDGFAATAPVERSGENAWGLFGAGGNVWETTSREPGSAEFGGWQGGGWEDHLPSRIASDAFYGFKGNARGAVNGFRLVLAPIDGERP
jgi:formylglycine-generating enzyme required for sulfatase activity